MAEVTVVKQTKERPELEKFFNFETPLFRGSMFGLNPFALMRQFTDDMDRVFTPVPRAGTAAVAAWTPAIEVKVYLNGDNLIVEGERKLEKEEKREGFFHSERAYGKFFRSILLPEGVKTDAISAEFTNGILEVTIPIAEVRKKEIPILEGSKKAA